MKKTPKKVTRRNGAKKHISMCQCGHIGDGPSTEHQDTSLEKGHGKCMIDGCPCNQFTWKEYV